MIARVVLVLLLGLAIAEAGDSKPTKEPRQATKCDTPVTHYLELGCRPIYSKRNGACPERFDCASLDTRTDAKRCYYKKKSYGIGESPGKGVIQHECSTSCVCTEGFENSAHLTCAQIECPEVFEPPNPDCIHQYRPKECCSYKEICDADEIKALKTCEWDGKVYREGEKFYPTDVCKTCVCNKDFDGTLKSLKCNTINCGIELFYADNLRQKCAPVFLESRDCCPIYWKCPEDGDEVVKSTERSNINAQCKYGAFKLNVGDTLKTNDDCLECSCDVPPMVTCIKPLNC